MSSGVDLNRQGPPLDFYLIVFERNQPAIKTFITIDGLYKYAKRHKQDKEKGFDWGPFEVYAVSTIGPTISKTTVDALVKEQNERIVKEVRARKERMGL